MRWVFCAVLMLGLSSPAAAADLDILRGPVIAAPPEPPVLPVGPATFTRWSGFYAGGSVGYSDTTADFAGATQSLVAFVLRDTTLEAEDAPSQWPVLGTTNQGAMSFGGFAGYNTQWQDLIIGVEADYSHAAFSLKAPSSPIGRSTSDSTGSAYAINFTGSGSLTASEFATLRLRGGWVAGDFLPYGFIGFALGVANTSVSVTGQGTQYYSGAVGVCTPSAPCVPFGINNSTSTNNQLLYGFTAGLGVDYAVTRNVFLRAEFEFDQFRPPPGILMSIATGRVGGGFKF